MYAVMAPSLHLRFLLKLLLIKICKAQDFCTTQYSSASSLYSLLLHVLEATQKRGCRRQVRTALRPARQRVMFFFRRYASHCRHHQRVEGNNN